jgi:sugar lactone lactonase YvrE
LVVDSSGILIVAVVYSNLIRKVTPGGLVSTLAGNGNATFADGTGADASFYRPYGVAIDADDEVFVADSYNHRVRKVSPGGVVSTLAGGAAGYADGTGTSAKFASPLGVAVASDGNV